MNKVILSGMITSDIEVTSFNGGKKVAKFSMETKKHIGAGDNRRVIQAYHNIEVWGLKADDIGIDHQLGDKILVVGSIQYNSWTNKNGEKKSKTVINAESYEAL